MVTQQQTFEFMASQQVTGEAALLPPTLDGEPDRQAMLRQLRSQAGCLSTAGRGNRQATFSSGSAAIDRLLPTGGLRTDAISEWIAEGDGSGAASLAMIAAASRLRCPQHGGGPLVVVSDGDHFYPPATIALGIPAERIIWVRASRHADRIWSIDQALRSPSVAAVWAWLDAGLDDRDARRFQLAAEAGRTPGLFLRPAATRHRPSFAELRLHVANRNAARHREVHDWAGSGRLLKVTLDRCRGGRLGESVWIQISDRGDIETIRARQSMVENHEKATVHLASELAHPKISVRRSQRA